MLLWLDDVRPAPPGWHHAYTAEQAKAAMLTGRVVYASLDHDLGFLQPTGYDLIRWMINSGVWPQYRPGVHSGNYRGAARMTAAIISHGPYR